MTRYRNTRSEVRVRMQGPHGATGSEVRATETPRGHRIKRQKWRIGNPWGYRVGGQSWDTGTPEDTGLEVREGVPSL